MRVANTRQQRSKRPNIFSRLWRFIFNKKHTDREQIQQAILEHDIEVRQEEVLAGGQITAINTEAKPTESKPTEAKLTEAKLTENKPIVAALASQIEAKQSSKPKVKESASSGALDAFSAATFGAAAVQMFLLSLPKAKLLQNEIPLNTNEFKIFEIYEQDCLPKSSVLFEGEFAVNMRNFFSFYNAHLIRKVVDGELYADSAAAVESLNKQLERLPSGKHKIALLLSLKEYTTWLLKQRRALDLNQVGCTYDLLVTMHVSDSLAKSKNRPEIAPVVNGDMLIKLQKEYQVLDKMLDANIEKSKPSNHSNVKRS